MKEKVIELVLLQEVYYKSPVGNLKIKGSETGICAVEFTDAFEETSRVNNFLSDCINQLHEYFSGKRKTFSLKFDLHGTDFQIKVWNELLNIPFGNTISYLELARRLGDEKVIRAAGSANGKNPLAIVVPCHRVIGSNGDLIDYGGGLHRKKWLLEFERGITQTSLFEAENSIRQ